MTKTVDLRLSDHEYFLILGVLRESAAGIPDRELRTRIGTTEAELTALRLKICDQGKEQGAMD